jgi:Ca-activated chloride channel homolog
MKQRSISFSAHRLTFLLVIALSALVFLFAEQGGQAQQQQRQTQTQPSPSPRATATPTPATTNSNRSTGTFRVPVPPPPPPPRPSPTPLPVDEPVRDDEIIRTETDLINLNVRVIDRQNRPLGDLSQNAFRVFEDGVEQQIALFTKEEVPISYGLVVDNSGSVRNQLQQIIDAAKTIIESNKQGDETFLVRFTSSDNIEVLQDFTSNQQSLFDALEDMYPQGGQTAVVDAVYLSAERVGQYRQGNALNDRRRRALILITDGEDRDSHYRQEQLFGQLREMDVQIYVIGFVNELEREGGIIRRSQRERAMNLLNRLASETGGRAFYPTALSELPGIAQEITRDMRTQYVLSYSPTNRARDGSFRRVRVAVAEGPNGERRIAVTRPGYTAPRDGGSAPTTTSPSNTRNPTTSPRSTSGTQRRP